MAGQTRFHGKKTIEVKIGHPAEHAKVMQANYKGSPPNSSWLTHVATLVVTGVDQPQDPEDGALVFAPLIMR